MDANASSRPEVGRWCRQPKGRPSPDRPTSRKQRRSSGHDAAFKAAYGTNKTRSNAFGRCVSKRSTATEAARTEAHTNAARQCKAEETADAAAFKARYGTGKNGANAYGKCVSGKAQAQTTETVQTEVKAEIAAMSDCKAERKADAAAFKAKYGTNRTRSNAFGKCVSAQAKAQQDDAPAQS